MGLRSLLSGVWSRATGRARRLRESDYAEQLRRINGWRAELREVGDDHLTSAAKRPNLERAEALALVCEAARRTIGLDPFDVQVMGGLVLADGHVAQMQTGEGKTLVATLPACAAALRGQPVHILSANDYLARRDALWMGPVYRLLGLSVGAVQQGDDLARRRAAYACDVLYGSATEIGFDYLRDQLRRTPEELVQRSFGLALIDEADSILIDEARIPLVIAGGEAAPVAMARQVDATARRMRRGVDFEYFEGEHRVVLTEAGAKQAESILGHGSLFESQNSATLAALIQALTAHSLVRRDVDYIVRDERVELIDETKGRLAPLRRWPDGLQAAVEVKEGLPIRHAGRILSAITLQNLISLYPSVCGMTGTAATQAAEFREIYGLEVVVVPTNVPVVRRDCHDIVWATSAEKHEAVVSRIWHAHAVGRPVLVGTASVAESEQLGERLAREGIAHHVLNAKNEEAEAAVIRQAGRPGAVTISTNMAGRGVDIRLGGDPPLERESVVAVGGLLVIGTSRHASRRIDHQLRGRAGRQGDPGESEFHLSLEDDLFQRFDLDRDSDIDHAQRIIEGQQLSVRQNLNRYERIVELQRRIVHSHRREVLLGKAESILRSQLPARYEELAREAGEDVLLRVERDITLQKIDDAWSRYLEEVEQTREDAAWVCLASVPLHEYQRSVAQMFEVFWDLVDADVTRAFASGWASAVAAVAPGASATWTYQTSDQAFPAAMARLAGSLRRLLGRRSSG